MLVQHRYPSPCVFDAVRCGPLPCFHLDNVSIEFANQTHQKMIRQFLYTHYWSRDPAVTALYLSLDSLYVRTMTHKYSTSGDRFLAFEWQGRGQERRLVGMLIANKTYPWTARELEQWSYGADEPAERSRMAFLANSWRASDIFKAHKVDVLVTVPEVMSQGLGALLLKKAIYHGCELQYPITTFLATSVYSAKAARSAGMVLDWAIDYRDYKVPAGAAKFYTRTPHLMAKLFIRKFDKKYPLPGM